MAILGADQVTIVDLTDGYTVTVAPESYAFPATEAAAKTGAVPVLVSALVGDSAAAATVVLAEVTAPAGVTVTKDTNPTTPTLTVAVSTAVTAPGVVTIPVHVGDVTIMKRFAFSLALTGAGGSAGVSATNVIIGNEAAAIPSTPAGKTVGTSTIVIPFAGYVGAARAATTAVASGLPAGMTAGTNSPATTSTDGSLTINVAAGANFGADATKSGEFTLTFTCNGQSHVKKFSWAKAVAGSDGTNGTNGANGADAIVMAVTSSNGTIFKNTAVATTLVAHIYKAGVELTALQIAGLGTVKWYKDGASTPAGTGVSLVIDAGQVASKATYEARLES